MSSLIANFFKRNVTLNMRATTETSPQTAYPRPELAALNGMGYEGAGKFFREYSDAIYRDYMSSKMNDYYTENLDPYGDNPIRTRISRKPRSWNRYGLRMDMAQSDWQKESEWMKKLDNDRDYKTLDIKVDTSKLDSYLKELDEMTKKAIGEQISKAFGVSKDDLLKGNASSGTIGGI